MRTNGIHPIETVVGVLVAILEVAVRSTTMTEVPETDGHRMAIGLDQGLLVEAAVGAVAGTETEIAFLHSTAMPMTTASPAQGVGNTTETMVLPGTQIMAIVDIEGTETGTTPTRAKEVIVAPIEIETGKKHPLNALCY